MTFLFPVGRSFLYSHRDYEVSLLNFIKFCSSSNPYIKMLTTCPVCMLIPSFWLSETCALVNSLGRAPGNYIFWDSVGHQQFLCYLYTRVVGMPEHMANQCNVWSQIFLCSQGQCLDNSGNLNKVCMILDNSIANFLTLMISWFILPQCDFLPYFLNNNWGLAPFFHYFFSLDPNKNEQIFIIILHWVFQDLDWWFQSKQTRGRCNGIA